MNKNTERDVNDAFSTKTWLAILFILFITSAITGLFLYFHKSKGTIANVYVNGECVLSVDLSKVKESYDETIVTEYGNNILRIEPGRICIKDADCHDKVCVRTGWISSTDMPIVCLPHKLVIKIEKSASKDELQLDSISK